VVPGEAAEDELSTEGLAGGLVATTPPPTGGFDASERIVEDWIPAAGSGGCGTAVETDKPVLIKLLAFW